MDKFRYIISAVLLLLVVAPGAYSAYSDIELVSSDETGCVFEWRLRPDLSNLTDHSDSPDSVALARAVTIGLPAGARAVIQQSEGYNPRSLPESVLNGRTPAVAPLVQLTPPQVIRERSVVGIMIAPVQDGIVHQAVRVAVRFVGGNTTVGRRLSDPKFDRLFKSLLINHEQALAWTVPLRPAFKAATSPFSSVSEWHKVYLNQTGLARLTGQELVTAGVFIGSVPSEQIRLFNGGGRQLPLDNAEPRPDLQEVALLIDDGGDAVFNLQDTLYFFSQALDRWDHTQADPVYRHHHYAVSNVYWLTTSSALPGPAARMNLVDASPQSSDTVISTYRRMVRTEQDSLLYVNAEGRVLDYYRWWWTDSWQPTVYIPAPDAVEGQSATVFTATTVYRPDTLYDLTVNGTPTIADSCWWDVGCYFETTDIVSGLNQFDFAFNGSGTALPYLDYVDVTYTSRLAPLGDRLDASLLSATSVMARLEVLDEFSAEPMVFDVTNPLRPRVLTGYEQTGGVVALSVDLAADQSRRLLAVTEQESFTPDSLVEVVVTDLRAITGQTDLIIITTSDLVPALQDYIAYRRQDGLGIRTVVVDDLYDNFAWGLMDPAAIRDFLKYAYENYPEPAPSTVLLVGDGDYDFLGRTTYTGRNFVPPFIHGDDDSYTYSDDNYLYFGTYGQLDSDTSYTQVPDRGVDMLLARWPVQSSSEIAVIFDKIRRYEQTDNLGPWRRTIALVADDEFAGDRTNEFEHTQQTEDLAELLPRRFELSKIYAIEHPFVNNTKPGVNQAIVDVINDGCLMVNYVGHGNPSLWAHEHFFTVADDLPRLTNYGRLPLFLAASCAIGFFDDPAREGMAEELLVQPDGGAVAVLSATRLVYSRRNSIFNRTVAGYLFGEEPLTMAEAVFAAKVENQYYSGSSQARNDRAYAFFGDPYLRLGTPPWEVEFDSDIDSLVALQPQEVTGRVVDQQGRPVVNDGTAIIRVIDSDRQRSYNSQDNGGTAGVINYSVDGPTIYRGEVAVDGGQFGFAFVPPLDIGYGGVSARVEVYAELDDLDALGVLDSIQISNQVAPVVDSTGPAITYSFGDRPQFADGDAFAPGEPLKITLSDSSGINLTGFLGHNISLVIDEATTEAINLTDLFAYDADDYTTGEISYPVGDLTPGQHSFKIKAWDNANNSSVVEFAGDLVDHSAPAVRAVLNYPNPMSDSTAFAFEAVVPLESFMLDIFTLSGRKIQSMSLYSLDAGYHQNMIWHGRDFVGDRVATGVYIYKATAHPVSGSSPTESFGKVVLIN